MGTSGAELLVPQGELLIKVIHTHLINSVKYRKITKNLGKKCMIWLTNNHCDLVCYISIQLQEVKGERRREQGGQERGCEGGAGVTILV